MTDKRENLVISLSNLFYTNDLLNFELNLRNHIIPKLSLSNQYINRRHSSMVSCLVIEHSEEKFMLSGDSNGDICLFDLDDFGVAPFQSITYKHKSSYRQNKIGHRALCTSLCWYPIDNGLFISSSRDKTVKIWDTENFELVNTYRYPDPVLLSITPRVGPFQHKLVGVCSGKKLSFIDLFTADQLREFLNESDVLSCDFNPMYAFIVFLLHLEMNTKSYLVMKVDVCSCSLSS